MGNVRIITGSLLFVFLASHPETGICDDPPDDSIYSLIQKDQDVIVRIEGWYTKTKDKKLVREDGDEEVILLDEEAVLHPEDSVGRGSSYCMGVYGWDSCAEEGADCDDCDGDGFPECADRTCSERSFFFDLTDTCVQPGTATYLLYGMYRNSSGGRDAWELDRKEIDVKDTGDDCLPDSDISQMPDDSSDDGLPDSGISEMPDDSSDDSSPDSGISVTPENSSGDNSPSSGCSISPENSSSSLFAIMMLIGLGMLRFTLQQKR